MGVKRNGARSFLDLSAKICKLSRMPGFNTGLDNILGSDTAGDLRDAFAIFCTAIDFLVATDNWFNQIDFVDEALIGGEDTGLPE